MSKTVDRKPERSHHARNTAPRRRPSNLVPIDLTDSKCADRARQLPAPTPCPKTVVSELEPAEQVVIWVLRQWLSGETGERLVRQELFNLCRLTAIEAAIQGLETLIDTLGSSGRRVLILHCCRCREVSHDERLLLCLIAAAQRPDKNLTQALARWLVPAALSDVLIEAARRFGLALRQGGHELPLALPST